jgi:spore coat protein H
VDYQEWESGVSNYWGNVLFQRCLKSETFRKALDDAVEVLRAKFTKEYIEGYTKVYADLLKPIIYTGADVTYAPLTQQEYTQVVNAIPGEIEDNYVRYKESLEKPMPFFIGVPQKKEDGYYVEWDASYDFSGEDVTYTFELAREYDFREPIVKKTDLVIPRLDIPQLPEGQYFMRVTSKNTSGQTQCAFDYYRLETGKVYGTKCFYVDKDGKITEDVYVE